MWLSGTLVHDLPVERTLIYVCCAEEQSRLFVSLSLDAIVCWNLLMPFVHVILFICSSICSRRLVPGLERKRKFDCGKLMRWDISEFYFSGHVSVSAWIWTEATGPDLANFESKWFPLNVGWTKCIFEIFESNVVWANIDILAKSSKSIVTDTHLERHLFFHFFSDLDLGTSFLHHTYMEH